MPPELPVRQPRCFVVDDEVSVCRLIGRALRQHALDLRAFGDVRSAAEALETGTPDLIFLDVALGNSDAIEAFRAFAAAGFAGAVQLMSGRDPGLLEEVRQIGVRYGFQMLPVLPKPFRLADVRQIIDRHGLGQPVPAGNSAKGCSCSRRPKPPLPKFSLDEVLDRGWLELWYQPKRNLQAAGLAGAEALIRARHPEHGILPPASFLPEASHGSLARLTESVLYISLRDWSAFHAAGHALRLAINVPISALLTLPIPTLVRENRPQVAEWPGLLLEVTEDQVLQDLGRAHEIATQLRIYDIHLSIDDFGAGYSSFARLREVPFRELKLDRSFVANCAHNPINAGLCQSIIDLAHRFGSMAVAEGIENEADLGALRRMGCDIGQGFHLGRPMPKSDFTVWLRRLQR